MSVLDKAERALNFLRAADTSKGYDVQSATSTLGRCLGALGSRPNYTRHYADLLPSAVPTLLSLASHDSAEVRLVGEEALNRAVVGGYPFHASKINITLQNQIDHTKSPRWIRAALSRVCLGECWLRPGAGKLRAQAQSLLPKLARVVRAGGGGGGGAVQLLVETLEANLPRVLAALADFATDEEIFELAHELMQHVDSLEAAVRRSAAFCVASLCKHRLPLVTHLLDTAAEKLWPEATESNVILGWFGAIKSLLQVNTISTLSEGDVFTVQDFLEIYQLCVSYIESTAVEHNTYNAVMECLGCLLSGAGQHKRAVLQPRPAIVRGGHRRQRAQYKNVAGGARPAPAAPLVDNELAATELHEQLTFSGALHLGSLSQLHTPRQSLDDLTIKTPDSPTSEMNFDVSAREVSRRLAERLAEQRRADDERAALDARDEEPGERGHVVKINIGTLHDDDVPLKYCARLLASKFLLTGNKGGVIPDRNVRVSVKASALNCLSAILQLYPQALTLYLDKDVDLAGHNISGSSEGAESNQDIINDFVLERNVCYQDSITDSFSHELLNKSMESYGHQTSQSASVQAASKREMFRSAGAESTEQKSSNRDVASNILDSKHLSGPKNELITSAQSADSTNPNMTNSNFTSNSNMTGSNDPVSTDYPMTSSGDVLSSSIDLDMKFDHFGESTSNIENFDALNLTRPPREVERMKTSEDMDSDKAPKRPLRRTDEVTSKDCPDDIKPCRSNNTEKKFESQSRSVDNSNVTDEFENQHMSDIITVLESHTDPQIRGLVRVMISSYLYSVLDLSHGDYTRWRCFTMLPKDIGEHINIANLMNIIIKGLSDEIHLCVNHSITSLSKILLPILRSVHTSLLPLALNALVAVETNPYWLCRVNLCKLYEKLPYERLSLTCADYHSRSSLIMDVLFRLLADQDQKVRNAASNAIAGLVPRVQSTRNKSSNSILIELAKEQTNLFVFDQKELALDMLKYSYFQSDLPEPLQDTKCVTKSDNLDNVVSEFVSRFMNSSCKFYSQGLLEGLLAVCRRWQPWHHVDSYLRRGVTELCLDTLDCCDNAVAVSGSLLAIATLNYPLEVWDAMQQKPADIFEKDSEVTRDRWQHLQSEKCCQLAEKFLQITLKMLNILVHLIEEINPNVHLHKTGIPIPGSPVRRKTQESTPRRGSSACEQDDKGGTRRRAAAGAGHARSQFAGQFVGEPFYMKLYDNLRAAYSNHKITLEHSSSMFYTFTSHVLDALATQLELATERELGGLTEEILHYLKAILPLRADKTVFCVTQLLKCLFGTNLASQRSDYVSIAARHVNTAESKFFEDVVSVNAFESSNVTRSASNQSSRDSLDAVSRRSSASSNMSAKAREGLEGNPRVAMERELLERMESFARNRSERKWNTNKKELERYIRLFEPVVIQALKSYTMQHDTPLQCHVLGLLRQLLTLRVNYCMLDSDQVFIVSVCVSYPQSYTMQHDTPLQCHVLGLLRQLLTLRVNYCMLDSDQVFIVSVCVSYPQSYTMQHDTPLQCHVLGLLRQLLTLRVNYCMLDSDQVFIVSVCVSYPQSYTMQHDTPLQCHVLGLLRQLLTLRVNYCMLDSDQVFIVSVCVSYPQSYTMQHDTPLQCHVLGLLRQLLTLRVNYCILDSDQVFIVSVCVSYPQSYTMQHDTPLQCHVLGLLRQLLTLRVNYCMLDSDQVFIVSVCVSYPQSYTMQHDTPLQCHVLGLLRQLLTLRVNYCMLDSDQVFIGFLLRQLELVEQNEIPDCAELVGSIISFLVMLSSSKHHTKQLMDIPKLIQLCDGLAASGRRDASARALRPLAARVFWCPRREGAAAVGTAGADAAVTGEVLACTLRRGMADAEVLDVVSCMLSLSTERDSYIRRSEQAADTALQLLGQRAMELRTAAAIGSLERLLDTICADVLLEQPRVEAVLKILFSQPPDQNTATLEIKERYLATVMVLLRKVLIRIPESDIILTIDYLKASHISPSSIFFNVKTEIDPLNVQNVNENCANLSPDVILVRFLFKTLTYAIMEIDACDDIECTDSEEYPRGHGRHSLMHAIAVNIICQVKNMLHLSSGCLFPLTAKTAQTVLHNEQSGLNTGLYSPEENIPLERLNVICVRRSHRLPLLTVHWSHLLIRLRFLEQKYWQSLLGYARHSPLSPESGHEQHLSLLQIGCFMAYCEYFVENGLTEAIHLTWLLVNRVHVLVSHCRETVVRALLDKLHDNASASGLLLQAVAARCQGCIKGEFALHTYRVLSKCHESQSGSLIFLICRIMGKLEPAVAVRFARLAVSRCRMLKELTVEAVGVQLAKEDVQVALEMLQRDKVHLRYSSLVVELNALASAVFDLSPLDLSQERTINPQHIVTTNVDVAWQVNQIKSRCCQASNEPSRGLDRLKYLASLLTKLSSENLTLIMSCPEFDRRILHSSFVLSCDNFIKEFLKVVTVYETKEAEKDNARKMRMEQRMREETVTSNIDSNILSVANNLTKFRKNSELEGSKSQFFIAISEDKDTSNIEEKFGNLEMSEEEPNEIAIPELPVLFTTALAALEKSISAIIRLFPKQNRPLSQSENFNLELQQTIDRYTKRCHQVFQDRQFYQEFCVVQSVVSGYLEALHRLFRFLDGLDCDISEKVAEKTLPCSVARNLAIFTVISLQYLSFLIKNKKTVESPVHSDVSFRGSAVSIDKVVVDDVIAITLRNASSALSFQETWSELNADSNSNRTLSAISCLYAVVKYCVKDTKPILLKKYVRSDEESANDICLTCDKLLTLIEYWEVTFYSPGQRHGRVLGQTYGEPIEKLIVALSRLELVCNVALIPPLAWPAVELDGKRERMQRIDLPLQALQDMDVLEGFLFRVNLMGRKNKKVWEEVWMCLLAALQGNGTHWAVRGVTQLLLSSRPAARCVRDYVDDSSGMQQLRGLVVGTPLYDELFEQVDLERVPFRSDPTHSFQFNTEYLRLASQISDDASFRVRISLRRVQRNTDIDVDSCLRLLMDVITQMLEPKATTGLSARCALIACAVSVSQLFTEAAQWRWLAAQLVALTDGEHRSLTQYSVASRHLLYGLCGALAVLEGLSGRGVQCTQELSTVHEKLLKWLNSSYAPLRQCALHGCLLQLGTARRRCAGATSASHRQLVAQLAHAVRQYLAPDYRISLYEQSLHWAALFKLVQLGHTELAAIAVDFLLLSPHHPCADLVVKGITTIIRTNALPKDLKKSIIEKLLDNRASYSEHHGIQILLVHLFSADSRLLSSGATDVSAMEPDVLVASMERLTLLYRVVRGAARAASAAAGAAALRHLLRALPPPATLSRVVVELLECCRARGGGGGEAARAALAAEIVFEVFETAVTQNQLAVLSGWLFEALCHLLGGRIADDLLPYCLLCLLCSASSNRCLRDLAPLTFHNLRLGFSVCDAKRGAGGFGTAHSTMSFADRRLLCLVALHSDFTKVQLEKLRELCGDNEVFKDLLKCLLSA